MMFIGLYMFCSIQNDHEWSGMQSQPLQQVMKTFWRPIGSKQIEHDFDIISLTSHLEIQKSIEYYRCSIDALE